MKQAPSACLRRQQPGCEGMMPRVQLGDPSSHPRSRAAWSRLHPSRSSSCSSSSLLLPSASIDPRSLRDAGRVGGKTRTWFSRADTSVQSGRGHRSNGRSIQDSSRRRWTRGGPRQYLEESTGVPPDVWIPASSVWARLLASLSVGAPAGRHLEPVLIASGVRGLGTALASSIGPALELERHPPIREGRRCVA